MQDQECPGSGSTENLEYIRCPTVSIWGGNPSIYTIRHEEIRTDGTRTIEQNGLLMQIILDCTSYKINQLIPYSNQDLVQTNRKSHATLLLCATPKEN